jgi:thioredoxin 1
MEIKVLDFTAKWCSTCQTLDKVLEKEATPKYKNKVKFIKVDVETDESMTNQYDILSVPTLIILRENKEIARISGSITKDKVMQELDRVVN